MSDISKEEFKKELEAFLNWTASRERPLYSWFSSLRDWAEMRFNQEFDKLEGLEKKQK